MASHEQSDPSRELRGPNCDLWKQIHQVASGRYGRTDTFTRANSTVERTSGTNIPVLIEEVHGGGLLYGWSSFQYDFVQILSEALPTVGSVLLKCEQTTGKTPDAEVQWWSSPACTIIAVGGEASVVDKQEVLDAVGFITYRPKPRQNSDGLGADLSVVVTTEPDSPAGAEYTRLAAEFGAESAGQNLLNGATEYVGGVVLPTIQQLQRSDGDPSATA